MKHLSVHVYVNMQNHIAVFKKKNTIFDKTWRR